MSLRQITIIGTGLIGGSFGLAVKKHGLANRVVGCDRESVLGRAKQMGAIDREVLDPIEASKGSEVVLLATPVGAIIDLIERLGPVISPDTLLADTGSTKAEIATRARAIFGNDVDRRFLPGHPMAGKEHSGIEHASAELFRGAAWVLTPVGENGRPNSAFVELLQRMGARAITMDAARHDRVSAWLSHLPQMVSTALAATISEALAGDQAALELAGPALRDMTRLASSPYSVWRDIALTNGANIHDALLRLEQRLAHLHENLSTRELETEFEVANKLRKALSRRSTEKNARLSD